jgi:hypothetical protein
MFGLIFLLIFFLFKKNLLLNYFLLLFITISFFFNSFHWAYIIYAQHLDIAQIIQKNQLAFYGSNAESI